MSCEIDRTCRYASCGFWTKSCMLKSFVYVGVTLRAHFCRGGACSSRYYCIGMHLRGGWRYFAYLLKPFALRGCYPPRLPLIRTFGYMTSLVKSCVRTESNTPRQQTILSNSIKSLSPLEFYQIYVIILYRCLYIQNYM